MLCVDKRHMKEMTFAVLQDGGEGLVARKPNTVYQSGRTEDVLKFKVGKIGEIIKKIFYPIAHVFQ
jgi:ATP-dependent DNA ligase